MTESPDRVSHASLGGIYVKAQELDRGHNVESAPGFAPPGTLAADAEAHASERGCDSEMHASDGADAMTSASSHASDASA